MDVSTEDPRLLVVGESLMDIVRSGEGEECYPGGSPMNVAFGLARLGDRVQFVTQIGRDKIGDKLVAHLESAGVELWPGSVVDAATSTAIATIDHHGVASYEFDIQWDLPTVDTLTEPLIVHAGSIGSFLEPGASAVRQILERCDGALITFDPNIRPNLLGSRAFAVAAVEKLSRLAHVVKLSDEDADWLYPGLSPNAVLGHLAELGPALVILTRGADGATFHARAKQVELPALATRVVDTIGAGDSFMAGVIDSILTNHLVNRIRQGRLSLRELEIIGADALACAAVTVSRAGAVPPTRAELEDTFNADGGRPTADLPDCGRHPDCSRQR